MGTDRLVKSEASYLIASSAPGGRADVANLLRRVIATLSREFGAFLIIELWAAPEGGPADDPAVRVEPPMFTVSALSGASLTPVVETLARQLAKIKVLKQSVAVETQRGEVSNPPGLEPLLQQDELRRENCTVIGLAVPPVYRRSGSQNEFPLVVRSLRRSLALALRRSSFEFARRCTTHQPPHYHALGRRAVVKAVWEVDRRLGEVSASFDYLLQLTPVNTSEALQAFRHSRFSRPPEFHYRPLPIDPDLVKRNLYKIPIERVEDPALQQLFQQKQAELELKLTMLRDRDTPRFLYESLQLFGIVEEDLLREARALLAELAPERPNRAAKQHTVDARAFAMRAEAEFAWYRARSPGFQGTTQLTSSVSGLMVSRGKLLINTGLTLAPNRVDALLAHEVGTHLLTYHNGCKQPFQQLRTGLAGYEALQEGLAVLAEYLVGGLSSNRMRQLAARVVAANCLIGGASFVETFRNLRGEFGVSERTAYTITMRLFRGGGLTKDVVYLRGLRAALTYLEKGGPLEALFVGKMALEHLPTIEELRFRKVLTLPELLPRYLTEENTQARLSRVREGGLSLAELVIPSEEVAI